MGSDVIRGTFGVLRHEVEEVPVTRPPSVALVRAGRDRYWLNDVEVTEAEAHEVLLAGLPAAEVAEIRAVLAQPRREPGQWLL